jgi:hypothetical protein
VGRRFYRVVESPRFLERLEIAEPSFIAVLLEHLYPILSAQPTGTTGDAPIVYERPFFSIELRGEGGWWGDLRGRQGRATRDASRLPVGTHRSG